MEVSEKLVQNMEYVVDLTEVLSLTVLGIFVKKLLY